MIVGLTPSPSRAPAGCCARLQLEQLKERGIRVHAGVSPKRVDKVAGGVALEVSGGVKIEADQVRPEPQPSPDQCTLHTPSPSLL